MAEKLTGGYDSLAQQAVSTRINTLNRSSANTAHAISMTIVEVPTTVLGAYASSEQVVPPTTGLESRLVREEDRVSWLQKEIETLHRINPQEDFGSHLDSFEAGGVV